MFIARGKAVHENLATSFVLVAALVDDLCEGGFSGAVEITLRDSDGYVIIDRGKLSAAIERREGGGYSRTTVSELAARSRRERGRVSVYKFPEGVASAIANRFLAQPLYTQLSTDFADLEKMLLKLSRERDRQWFIEVSRRAARTVLVHLLDDRCQVVTEEAECLRLPGSGGLDPSKNGALGRLLDEVNTRGRHVRRLFRAARGGGRTSRDAVGRARARPDARAFRDSPSDARPGPAPEPNAEWPATERERDGNVPPIRQSGAAALGRAAAEREPRRPAFGRTRKRWWRSSV